MCDRRGGYERGTKEKEGDKDKGVVNRREGEGKTRQRKDWERNICTFSITFTNNITYSSHTLYFLTLPLF